MTQINDIETGHETRYETPSFALSSGFAWTLRSAEIARRNTSRAPLYETPTFDPRGAFAWTLRSAEIARRERRQRPLDRKQIDAIACAA